MWSYSWEPRHILQLGTQYGALYLCDSFENRSSNWGMHLAAFLWVTFNVETFLDSRTNRHPESKAYQQCDNEGPKQVLKQPSNPVHKMEVRKWDYRVLPWSLKSFRVWEHGWDVIMRVSRVENTQSMENRRKLNWGRGTENWEREKGGLYLWHSPDSIGWILRFGEDKSKTKGDWDLWQRTHMGWLINWINSLDPNPILILILILVFSSLVKKGGMVRKAVMLFAEDNIHLPWV